MLNFCYNVKFVGYLGIEKILVNLKLVVYWLNMIVECYDYVKFCLVCNLNKKFIKIVRVFLKFF